MQAYNTGNYEKYNSKNPLKRLMVERLNKQIIVQMREMIGNREGKILDAGCGEGYISRLLASSFCNAKITGLEYNVEAIHIAKKMSPNINFIQGNIMSMPFPDNAFDIVVCTEVLEHLDQPEKALKETLRISMGGVLVTVPNEPWFCLGNIVSLKNLTRFGNPIDHINHWTYSSFSRWINNELGYETCHIEHTKCFPWQIARIEQDSLTS